MPRPEHLAEIADATGRTADYFLGDDEDEEAAMQAAVGSLVHALVAEVRREVARQHEGRVVA